MESAADMAAQSQQTSGTRNSCGAGQVALGPRALMPVSRRTAEHLARDLAGLYSEAERRLLRRIARDLARGIHGPHWAEQQYARMLAYQGQTLRLIEDLQRQARSGAATTLTEAYRLGGLAAIADLTTREMHMAPRVPALWRRNRALERLEAELLGKLDAMGPRILRASMDLYREAVAAGTREVLLGTQTRLQATQGVLDRFAAKGITGFVDKAGRGWNLESYAEMAVRAGTMNASVSGHMDAMTENGLDLVIVSEDGSPCELCEPWEGEILSISGSDPQYQSVDDCEAAGWGHPGCLHNLSAYQEGITRPYPEKTAADRAAEAQAYKDNQAQRGIERQIRASKRMQAAAMDAAARAKAGQRVAYYQAKAREHVASTSAIRKYGREQVGKAH